LTTAAFFVVLPPEPYKINTIPSSYCHMLFLNKVLFMTIVMVLVWLVPSNSTGQTATVWGTVTDQKSKAVDLVHVTVIGSSGGVTTDRNGRFEIRIPSDTVVRLGFSFIGFDQQEFLLRLNPNERRQLDVTLIEGATMLPSLEVRDEKLRSTSLTRLNPKQAMQIPSSGGGIEDLIKTLPGVSSNNELSSQYTVRGGNFDENLVYVNDIEIYRPFLVRSGQQEGLSFLNSALVSSILFSAGGFNAEYGDKLSSVLDITYKRPTETAGSVSASLLGAEMHVEGSQANRRFTYLVGARYKTTAYLLNALETQGSYRPDFSDIQSMISYGLHPKWELSLLGYYSRNKYNLIPESRQTDFGTIQEAYRLNIYFEGQEVDRYETGMGAITLSHKPDKNLELKLIASAFSTVESETYDVLGQYWIGRLETSPGDEQFGNVVQAQGVGSFLEHARNYFDAQVVNLEHKATLIGSNSVTKWGLKFQHQRIHDRVHEWEMIDSACYSLPIVPWEPDNPTPGRPDFQLNQSVRADNRININSYSAFVQQAWNFFNRKGEEFVLTAGVRANYWDYGKEFKLSPRASVAYKPNWERKMVFRLAGGVYNQPPFYRELRLFDGSLYPDSRSQQSFHLVGGTDLNFTAWNRPFVFTGEAYYKFLNNLIPYEVDNVRIRYYADQEARGYAAGLDFKVNGEFVKGVESWMSMSLMKTEEDIRDDFTDIWVDAEGKRVYTRQLAADTIRLFPGMIPRPSDQRFNFSIFFQDYIPGYPTFRVHLKLLFGTSLPFGPPNAQRSGQTLRMPPYRRVDIGFSKQLVGEHSVLRPNSPFRYIRNSWISLEVFNLLQISNTISYIWVKDIENRQYAVPNYLTPRQVNLKLVVEF